MAQVTITIDADNRSEDEIRQILQGIERVGDSAEQANKDVEQQVRQTIAAVRRANQERIREDRYLIRLQEDNRRRESNALRDALTFRRTQLRQQNQDEQRVLRDALAFRRNQIKQTQRAEEQARRAESRALRDALTFRRNQIRRQQQEERDQLRRTQRLIRSVSNAYRSFTSRLVRGVGLGALFGGHDIIRGIRSTIEAATEIDTIRRTLTALTGDVTSANRQLERFRELARLPGVSFVGAANAAIQFRNVGVELPRAIELMRELGNVASFSGQQLSDVSFNIAQLIAQGQFNQRDLREAINRMQLLGRALGSTVSEELNMALQESGQDIATFLTERLRTLPRADAESASNIFNNFRIAVRNLQAEIGQLALPELTRHVRDLTEYIRQNANDILQRFESGIRRIEVVVNGLRVSFRELFSAVRAGLIAGVLARLGIFLSNISEIAFTTATGLAGLRQGFANLFGSGGIISVGIRSLSALSIVGATAAGAFALFEFFRFIRGMNQASDSSRMLAEEQRKLRQALNDTNESIREQTEDINNLSVEQAQRELQRIPDQIFNIRRDFESLFDLSFADVRSAPIADEISRSLGIDDRRIEGVGRFISALRRQRQEYNRELEALSPGAGTAGALQRFATQAERIKTEINTIDAAINAILGVLQRRADLQRRINEGEREAEQSASDRSFRIRRRPDIENNAIAQAAIAVVEREVQDTIRFRQQSADRQDAIAEDLGRRAVVRRRNSIQAARVAAEQEVQAERDAEFRRNAAVLEGAANRTIARRQAQRQQLEDFTNFANEILDREQRFNNARRRNAERERQLRDQTSRQTDEQRSVVDDFVSATEEDRIRRIARIRYDSVIANQQIIENSERQHSETIIAIQEGVARQGLNSALALAFDRRTSFREVAAEFLRQSVRIIAQNLLETQFILANNERLIESNNRLAQSRQAALGVGLRSRLPAGADAVVGAAANLITGNITGAVSTIALTVIPQLKIGSQEARDIGDYQEDLRLENR